uniref:Uncharacterized protein LOC104243763 n=1 Tax=Nicotiana sylvestris TaxID=4096 RepID=A0A1U7YET0_NICSY|nr:PREDICTED: uncharacterized protein LOC104243763 [Nicotiana sylvestris]
MIASIELAKSLRAEVIEAKCDSLLVVNQVNKSFEVREDRIQRYLDKLQVTLHHFKKWTLDHVPREKNSEADALANLGSLVEEDDVVLGTFIQLSRSVVEEGHAEINSTSLTWNRRNKWVEAQTFEKVREKEVIDFIWDHIIYRFGIPAEIAESINKTIIQNLKKRLNDLKGKWMEVLPEALWAYWTTSKSSTGATPFSLVNGSEALIPIKVREPSARFRHASEESNHKVMNSILELLDEKREATLVRMAV